MYVALHQRGADDLDVTQFVCLTCGRQRGGATTATLTGSAGDVCVKGAACATTSQLQRASSLQANRHMQGSLKV